MKVEIKCKVCGFCGEPKVIKRVKFYLLLQCGKCWQKFWKKR